MLIRKPDVFFLMLSEPAAAAVVRQLRAMRYSGDIVMQSSMLQTYDRGARARFLPSSASTHEHGVKHGATRELERSPQLSRQRSPQGMNVRSRGGW